MKISTLRVITGVLLLLLVFQVSGVYAQGEVSDSLLNEKIKFIETNLKKDEQKTLLWWDGWLAAYSAATVGQGVVYFVSNDKATRQDMALGAATTLLGAAGQFISTIRPRNGVSKLELLPDGSLLEKEKKLLYAETLLKEQARCENAARNWQEHLLPSAVNLSSGLITWIGFKRTVWDGVVNFALNTVITEAQIWSQPLKAKKAYEKYNLQYANEPVSRIKASNVDWFVGVYPGGAAIRIEF